MFLSSMLALIGIAGLILYFVTPVPFASLARGMSLYLMLPLVSVSIVWGVIRVAEKIAGHRFAVVHGRGQWMLATAIATSSVIPVYGLFKQYVLKARGFPMDATLAEIDRFFLFGFDAWEITHHLFPSIWATILLDRVPQMGADEFSSNLTVLPDIRSNSVVVSGTNDDLRLLHELIEKVDIVLPQVRIEVVIVEVKLSDNETNGFNTLGLTVTNGKLVGIGGTGGGFNVNGTPATANTTLAPNNTQINASQGTFNTTTNDLSATIGLTTTPRKGDLKVLSVPAVTTTHNKEATIFVGESRPVITGSTIAAQTGQITSTVSQRDIGIQLKVLPLIGKDGAVQLQVSQSVEDILGSTILDGNDQPIIGRRTTDSYVSAMSGEIVVLGGLQRTISTKSTSRLGPIPFLGDLFGSSTVLEEKQELIIFLRPYVLNNSAVDNLDAISRATAGALGAEAKKVIDNVPGKIPAAPAQK